MKSQYRRGFEHDGGLEQPARAHEAGAQRHDHPIRRREIRRPLPRTVEYDELLLEQQRLDRHGSCTAWPEELRERRHKVNQQNGKLAHVGIVAAFIERWAR